MAGDDLQPLGPAGTAEDAVAAIAELGLRDAFPADRPRLAAVMIAAPDGRASGRQIEGSIHGPGSPAQITPRLRAILERGLGRWITVFANSGHAYAVIAGLRWDTSGTGGSDGCWCRGQARRSGLLTAVSSSKAGAASRTSSISPAACS